MLPTIVSFLICALVVGVSLFFLSIGEPSLRRVVSSAVLLGAGIVSMHYVGIHGLSGNFAIEHDRGMVLLSVLIAIVTAYGGLRAFLARQDGIRLIASSIAFGVAVSGMHYTAMYGMHFVACSPDHGQGACQRACGVAADPLGGRGAVLCFVIAAGFLLSLVPDPRRQAATSALPVDPAAEATLAVTPGDAGAAGSFPRLTSAPLGGLGQPPRPAPAPRLPVEGADGTHFIDTRRRAQRPGRCSLYTGCMTAPASGCVRGRSRKPKRSSIPACSSGCIAAISWRSRMSLSCARKVTAP